MARPGLNDISWLACCPPVSAILRHLDEDRRGRRRVGAGFPGRFGDAMPGRFGDAMLVLARWPPSALLQTPYPTQDLDRVPRGARAKSLLQPQALAQECPEHDTVLCPRAPAVVKHRSEWIGPHEIDDHRLALTCAHWRRADQIRRAASISTCV